MEWFKKHTDTVVVIGAIVGSMLWMNGKFEEVYKEISNLDKEVSIIKTILIMKNIMPPELAHSNGDKA